MRRKLKILPNFGDPVELKTIPENYVKSEITNFLLIRKVTWREVEIDWREHYLN